ncbi:hypothetical protein [Natranaerofaba carboxydovora]|nr:hypothetical protein [Natranaerofaba carboxydovora]
MGIIYFQDREPVALTIMVQEPEDMEEAQEEIGQLTNMIIDSLG